MFPPDAVTDRNLLFARPHVLSAARVKLHIISSWIGSARSAHLSAPPAGSFGEHLLGEEGDLSGGIVPPPAGLRFAVDWLGLIAVHAPKPGQRAAARLSEYAALLAWRRLVNQTTV